MEQIDERQQQQVRRGAEDRGQEAVEGRKEKTEREKTGEGIGQR
jgi:hypothetical protein